ncbi:MAG: TonB family protein [Bdellovibrionales bacterium]|nr:TonB family protein [Bdellovibrionales bacterium]
MENIRFSLQSQSDHSELNQNSSAYNADEGYQLSFDDLQSFSLNQEVVNKIPYVDYLLLNGRIFTFPKKRFFIISFFIHAALLVTLLVYTFNNELMEINKPKENLISFTIEDSKSGSPAPTAVVTAATAPTPSVKTTPSRSKSNLPKTASVKSHAKASSHRGSKPVIATHQKASHSSSSYQVPTTASSVETFDDAPASIDDIAIPTLNEVNTNPSTGNAAQLPPNFNEIKENFDEIDEQSNSQLVAANDEINQLTQKSLDDIDDQSQQIEEDNSKLDTLAANKLNQLAQEKEQQALAAQRKAARLKQAGRGGTGASPSGSGLVGTSGSGSVPGGKIRKLEELRQMPGNKKPQYSINERLKGLSGDIVLYGFVTKQGSLSSLRVAKSTGYQSLDDKTFAAVKNWKFYPGQEGWVELPFKWDLKGGVQQKPTLLRRR